MARGFGWWAAVAASVGVLAVVGVAIGIVVEQNSREEPVQGPVRQAEAEAVLTEAVRLANTVDAQFCEAVSVSASSCHSDVSNAMASGWYPDAQRPAVTGTQWVPYSAGGDRSGTLILHLLGHRRDGVSYTTDFVTVRTESGQVRTLTPAYWNGASFTIEPPCDSRATSCGKTSVMSATSP